MARKVPIKSVNINPVAVRGVNMQVLRHTSKVGYAYHAEAIEGVKAPIAAFMKTNRETQELYRGKNGEVCINLVPGETAVALGEDSDGPVTRCVYVYPDTFDKVVRGQIARTSKVGYFFDDSKNVRGAVFVRTNRDGTIWQDSKGNVGLNLAL